MKNPLVKVIAATLSLVLFCTNTLLAGRLETNFWKERRKSAQMAALPSEPIGGLLPTVNRTSLITSSVVRALPARADNSVRSMLSVLPANVGTVRKILLPAHPSGRTVVHIQDVHHNSEAQSNIAAALQGLIRADAVEVVALEGAFAPIDLSWYRAHRAPRSVRAVADYLLRTNRIAGPMHVGMTGSISDPSFVGVDDVAHYEANVAAVRDAASLRSSAQQKQLALEQEISAAKAAAFGGALREFDATVESYRAGTLSWSAYMEALSGRATVVSSGIANFVRAIELERQIDFTRMEMERGQLIASLVRTLSADEQRSLLDTTAAYKAGALGYTDFYAFLKELCHAHGVSLARFPTMDAYIRYVMLADSLDVDTISNEAVMLEKNIFASLAATPEQRDLVARSRRAYLTGRLLNFSLTKTEWREYASLNTQPPFEAFERFYREAEIRDAKMADNTIRAAQDGSTVLVTGGFHSAGVDEKLVAAGFSVISFVPKISSVADASGSAYLSVFTQEKTPLDKLFAGEKLFLATLAEPSITIAHPMVDLAAHLREANEVIGQTNLDKKHVLSAEISASDESILSFQVRIRAADRDFLKVFYWAIHPSKFFADHPGRWWKTALRLIGMLAIHSAMLAPPLLILWAASGVNSPVAIVALEGLIAWWLGAYAFMWEIASDMSDHQLNALEKMALAPVYVPQFLSHAIYNAVVRWAPLSAAGDVDFNATSDEQRMEFFASIVPDAKKRKQLISRLREMGAFASIDDLARIPGLGEGRMRTLKDKYEGRWVFTAPPRSGLVFRPRRFLNSATDYGWGLPMDQLAQQRAAYLPVLEQWIHRYFAPRFLAATTDSDTVVELGSGDGLFWKLTRAAADAAGRSGSWIHSDLLASFLSIVSSDRRRVMLDMTNPYPFADNSLQAVVTMGTLYGFSEEDLQRIAMETARVVVPGGSLFAIADIRPPMAVEVDAAAGKGWGFIPTFKQVGPMFNIWSGYVAVDLERVRVGLRLPRNSASWNKTTAMLAGIANTLQRAATSDDLDSYRLIVQICADLLKVARKENAVREEVSDVFESHGARLGRVMQKEGYKIQSAGLHTLDYEMDHSAISPEFSEWNRFLIDGGNTSAWFDPAVAPGRAFFTITAFLFHAKKPGEMPKPTQGVVVPVEFAAPLVSTRVLLADKPASDNTVSEIAEMLAGFNGTAQLIDATGVGKDKQKLMDVIAAEKPAVIVIRSATKAFGGEGSEDMLAFAKKHGVKMLIRAGAGVDNINVAAAEKNGIVVERTHGNANSVANLALRFLLVGLEPTGHAAASSTGEASADVAATWPDVFDMPLDEFAVGLKKTEKGSLSAEDAAKIFHPVTERRARVLIGSLEGKTIGLVGFGPIAQDVARKLQRLKQLTGVNFNVVATSRSLDAKDEAALKLAESLGVQAPGEERVLHESTVLSLHLPSGAATKNYLNAARMTGSRVKLVINTSRQDLVDPQLWSAMSIAPFHLGFDYYADVDFNDATAELQRSYPDTVHLTPHIGASTPNAAAGVESNTKEMLRKIVVGKDRRFGKVDVAMMLTLTTTIAVGALVGMFSISALISMLSGAVVTALVLSVRKFLNKKTTKSAETKLLEIEKELRPVPARDRAFMVGHIITNIEDREADGVHVSDLMSRRVPSWMHVSRKHPEMRLGLFLMLQMLRMAGWPASANATMPAATHIVRVKVVRDEADLESLRGTIAAQLRLRESKRDLTPAVWSVAGDASMAVKIGVIEALEPNLALLPVAYVIEGEAGFDLGPDGTFNLRTLFRVANKNRERHGLAGNDLFRTLSVVRKAVPANVQIQLVSKEAVPYGVDANDANFARAVWIQLLGLKEVWISLSQALDVARLAAKMA